MNEPPPAVSHLPHRLSPHVQGAMAGCTDNRILAPLHWVGRGGQGRAVMSNLLTGIGIGLLFAYGLTDPIFWALVL